MSGNTDEAPPFLIHAINTCYLLDGHEVGRTDIKQLAHQLQRIFADNRKHVSHLAVGQTTPRVLSTVHLALAGWSWRRQRFEAYTYWFNQQGELVSGGGTLEGPTKSAHFIGDGAVRARSRLKSTNQSDHAAAQRAAGPGVRTPHVPSYDWQPLQVLLDAIEDDACDSVGGAPQVTRIYQNGLTESFIWRSEDGAEHFGGRPILDTERSDRRVMSVSREGGRLAISIEFSDRSYPRTAGTSVGGED